MFESHIVISLDRTRLWQALILILRFFQQNAFVNNHLGFWPTIHNSTSKICPKFQILSSHFSRLMSWKKIVESENLSTPINGCTNQRFDLKNSGILCLVLIFNLNNLRTTILCTRNREVARHKESDDLQYCWYNYGSVFTVSHRE